MSENIVGFKVRVALKVKPELEDVIDRIGIEAVDGFVTLSGMVPSRDAAMAAEQAAVSVADVTGVNNLLEIEQSEAAQAIQ